MSDTELWISKIRFVGWRFNSTWRRVLREMIKLELRDHFVIIHLEMNLCKRLLHELFCENVIL